MKIETSRFGTIEAGEEDLVHFPSGIIGFPAEKQFILIPHANSSIIAWLQSVQTPGLAFPVVSAHGLIADYPDVSIAEVAERYGIPGNSEELAVLVVLSAPRNQPATVNLLAPLVVSSSQRKGAQVFLEGSRFTTRELFVLPDPRTQQAEAENDSEAPAEAAAV